MFSLLKNGSLTLCIFLFTPVVLFLEAEKRANPDKPIYELTDFSATTIGTKALPVLRAKAAESGSLFAFALRLAEQHRGALPHGPALVAAGQALGRYLEITRSSGPSLDGAAWQQLVDAVVRFLSVRESAGISWKPKMHLMVHLVCQSARCGNPRCLASTWVDEGLNMKLAEACRIAHSSVWSRRVLATFAHPSGPTGQAAKRGRR